LKSLNSSTYTVGVEEGYRVFYNVVLIVEGKAWSTPIIRGENNFRKNLFGIIRSLSIDIGANDAIHSYEDSPTKFRSITLKMSYV